MIRNASRFLLVVCLAVPGVVRAQAPWRRVYKDGDVTVIFDTATAASSMRRDSSGRSPVESST